MSSHYACESRDLLTVVDNKLNHLIRKGRSNSFLPCPVLSFIIPLISLVITYLLVILIMFSLLFKICEFQNTLNTFIFVLFPHPIISSFDAGGGNKIIIII